jgi:hypothetical protein
MEMTIQGPITGKGRVEPAPELKGKTTEPVTPETKGTTEETPVTTEGRAEPDKGTSKKEEAPKKSATEESFLGEFDISTLSEEGRLAYEHLNKQFKSAYTKKLESVKKDREKVEAYNNFMSNPEDNLKRAADQYGYKMVPKGQTNQIVQGDGLNDWQPQTWDEVFSRFEERVSKSLMGQFKPVFDNLQNLTSTNIERQLTDIDPDWKMYEEDMMSNLKAHPTLAKDVSKLYKLSVPEDVLKNKYTQVALKKFEEKAKSSKISSKSSVSASSAPVNKKLTFTEAVDEAKRRLATQT